ncbi:hypothetical protein Pmar_PMAR019673 [Perkinsus marinus ATCC 50983]|uniref:Uncharacterized protein n=1 Tax=Perkinsus marinus (strain ATCC 50983 / TXsc) TaxID=423536 RepID=C5LF54_PERM5|nr:hypothetical protein Pmar_PMAR019673 [Perkinsus marinus ATCC 50983]EER04638.1 hypothetical protein Pmar_PMAR019673 [Perkinsus marinus ATCC 50983]|eukprot:XP_002772822.1 hypothetical protein Pmar_PMAR019673 [Perkinsus marinus ATCC 50983]
MLFYDETLNPYWEYARCLANDVLHPPADTEEDGAGVDLLATRAAKKCAKGAVFYIHPPVNIKFASPSAGSDDVFAPSIPRHTNDTAAAVENDFRGA